MQPSLGQGQKIETGSIYTVEGLWEYLRFAVEKFQLDGITVSGGEPLLQNDSLKSALWSLKKEFKNLDFLVYTGYEWDESKKSISTLGNISLDWIDILIDGPFRQNLAESEGSLSKIRGSKNQKIWTFSDLGEERVKALENDCSGKKVQLFNETDGFFQVGII